MPGEQIFGLIGYPLGHSFSKKYFTGKFEREGLTDHRFELFPLVNIRLFPGLLLSEPALRGLAVTIPYKEQVMPYLSSIDPVAEKIGAVNCIRIKNAATTGFNTDVIGFERSLLPLLQPQHTHALVLGSGGASKAVQYVLTKLGIEYIIVSRKDTNDNAYMKYESISSEVLKQYRLIINCTPVGMEPDVNSCPQIPYQFLNHNHLLYDLVYKPPMTLFLQNGFAQGAAIKNGYEMLLIQAEENWRIW